MDMKSRLISLPSIPIDESGESTRIVRSAIWLLVFGVAVGSLWGALAPLSGAVIANGSITIDTHRKTIQHLDGGIVKEILVREGSRVEAGQPLIVLEDTQSSANLQILRDQLNALLLKEARLEAEKRLAGTLTFPSDLTEQPDKKVAKLLANEEAVFAAKRKSLDDEIALLNKEIEETKVAESGLVSQVAAINESIRYISRRLDASLKLQKKKFVSDMDVLAIRESLSQKRESRGEATADLAQLRQRLADLELKIVNLRHNYIENADIEYQETKKQIFEIEERLRPATDVHKRQVIAAPIDGQVIAIKVTTIGGVIKAGEPLMDIVPENVSLVVEAKVKPNDIENVRLGQPADVQLDAYNKRTTPLLSGAVVYVSGDRLDNPANDESYYLAHIEVPPEALQNLDKIALSPGMPVTAFLQTSSRTFFEYLMSPLVDHLRRAFRED